MFKTWLLRSACDFGVGVHAAVITQCQYFKSRGTDVRKFFLAVGFSALTLFAPQTVSAQDHVALFITPTEDNFEVYLSAAMAKKQVPVRVVTKEAGSTLVLKASAVEVQQQSTGSKFARCLFAYCAGIEDRGATSVQLLKGDAVVWSYSVNKGRGQKNRQSLAEAIAKHMKDEYFHK